MNLRVSKNVFGFGPAIEAVQVSGWRRALAGTFGRGAWEVAGEAEACGLRIRSLARRIGANALTVGVVVARNIFFQQCKLCFRQSAQKPPGRACSDEIKTASVPGPSVIPHPSESPGLNPNLTLHFLGRRVAQPSAANLSPYSTAQFNAMP